MEFPVSYKDPLYDQYETELEEKYGIPSGITKAVRTKGEKTNHGQWSAANKATGASTVYQITPKTRALFLKAYGVDAYAGPREAAEVAVLHLRDDMRREAKRSKGKATQDELWNAAVRNYIGGTNPKNHGKVTAAYVARAGKGGGEPGSPPLLTASRSRNGGGEPGSPPLLAATGRSGMKTPLQMVNAAIGLPEDDDDDSPELTTALPRKTASILPDDKMASRPRPTLTQDAPMQMAEADPYPGIDIGDITKRMRQRAEELWRIS